MCQIRMKQEDKKKEAMPEKSPKLSHPQAEPPIGILPSWHSMVKPNRTDHRP